MAQPVLASEDAADNLSNCVMLRWRLRTGGGFRICCCDIGQQSAHVLFADQLEISQGEKERLADAECSRTVVAAEKEWSAVFSKTLLERTINSSSLMRTGFWSALGLPRQVAKSRRRVA
jgi:hypothetical protein